MRLENRNKKTLKQIGDYAARIVEWNKRDNTDNRVQVWMENGMLKYGCLDDMPTCENCQKLYRVDIVKEDGFKWEHVPQGFFGSLQEANTLRNKLIKDGFECVVLVHNRKQAIAKAEVK